MSNQKLIDLLPGSISSDTDMAAMAEAVQPQLDDIDTLIPSIEIYRRINELPEKILRMLAWENGLHGVEWELALTYEDKLNLVKNSFELNKRRGTRWSVERIFELLRLKATIVEWWEEGGPPATFRISTLDVSERGILESELALLDQLVAMYKPLSRHILGVNMLSGIEVESYSHGAASVVVSIMTSMVEDSFYQNIIDAANAEGGGLYLFQLEYGTYAGQQVIWQDAAGTIPWEPGQGAPQGKVLDLCGSGEYLHQPVSMRRPVDGVWDGVGTWMDASSDAVGGHLHQANPSGSIAGLEILSEPMSRVFWATKTSTSTTVGDGMLLRGHTAGGLVQYVSIGSGNQPYTLAVSSLGILADGQKHYTGVINSGSDVATYADGLVSTPLSYASYADVPARDVLRVGANTAGSALLHAKIDYIAIYTREPTPYEISLHQRTP